MWADELSGVLARLRDQRPVVHHLTNSVTMELQANVTLALGGIPLMAVAPEEMPEVVSLSSALVVNLGTPTAERLATIRRAVGLAREGEVPWVMDPVGAGLSRFRSRASQDLLAVAAPDVLKGNLAEMEHLAGLSRGDGSLEHRQRVVRRLSREHGLAAAVTGPRDVAYGDGRGVTVRGGTHLLDYHTGMGCAAASIMGCLLAAGAGSLRSAWWGLALMAAASTLAESRGPGSLVSNLLDALYHIDGRDVQGQVEVESWQS